MFNRLSIFSFDTLKGIPRPTRPFFLCVFILIIAGSMLSINRGNIEKSIPKYHTITPVLSYIDNYCIDSPKVAFFGSSRFVSCIKTDIFAKLSDIAPSNVLNLSLGSGSFWEANIIYRQQSELYNDCSLVIIDIEPWMFNKNIIHPIFKKQIPYEPYFTVWASLQERLEFNGIATKASLVSDFFWPLSERRSFPEWFDAFSALKNNQNKRANLSIPTYQYNAKEYQALASSQNFEAFSIANDHLNNFEFAKHKADSLQNLVKQFEKQCDHIVLLQPPVRKKYMDVIYNNPDYHATYKQVLAFIHSLENDKVDSIIWETPSDCGLDDSVFIDYGHFNLHGAQKFTEILYNNLNIMGLIAPNTMDDDVNKYPADENIAILQEKLKYQPANVSYRYTLGMLYEKNGQLDKAQREFETALKLEPGSMKILKALAMVYVNKKQYQEAILTFKRLVDIQPENNIFYYNISCLYAIQNMKNESIEWLTKAIENGYSNWDHLKNDKDLENIKNTSYFKSLVNNTP